MMSQLLEYAVALVFGYLCGSIPFGIVLTRLAGAPDLRSIGSGNILGVAVMSDLRILDDSQRGQGAAQVPNCGGESYAQNGSPG